MGLVLLTWVWYKNSHRLGRGDREAWRQKSKNPYTPSTEIGGRKGRDGLEVAITVVVGQLGRSFRAEPVVIPPWTDTLNVHRVFVQQEA